MRSRQRGVAIVLAMSVVALAAMAAVGILVSQSTWARHSELASGHAQAQQLARAGIDWARAVLAEDRRISNLDHLGEPWAVRAAPVSVESGQIGGSIDDAQARFNVNNLAVDGIVSRVELLRLRRLLEILELPQALAEALADWIDADGNPLSAAGAEDAYYASLPTPYLAANRPLADISELALVKGFDEQVITKLRPFVIALPLATQVNVNTAPAEVLAATIDGLTLDAARALVKERERKYFYSVQDFANRLPGSLKLPETGIALASRFFMVSLQARAGSAQSTATALLSREAGGWPTIIWQKVL